MPPATPPDRAPAPSRLACPYLGRAGDPDTHFVQPHPSHRCQAVEPAERIELDEQARFCYGEATACPRYLPLDEHGRRAPPVQLGPAVIEPEPSYLETGQVVTAPAVSVSPDVKGVLQRAERIARRLSFEEWTVYTVSTILILAIAWSLFGRGSRGGEAAVPTVEPGVRARAVALLATDTATPTPLPTPTTKPTRPPREIVPATAAVPAPPEGGLIAALTPSERGVGSFNDADRLPAFGQRELNVGRFDGRDYIGGMLFPLTKLPKGSRIAYVALELTGLADTHLAGTGAWTVEMLDPAAADTWSNLTYQTLLDAPARQMRTAWQVRANDLAPRRVNVLEFSDDARDLFISRLEQGKVAFRLRGPQSDPNENNLFAWDTGYGEGFGTRPVLRVGFVPPPPTAGPKPGEPTALPLIVWVAEPTPAPTATPLPGEAPGLLSGMILFLSDRFGQAKLMVYDPAGERVGQVTQAWPYAVAKARQASASGVGASVKGMPCGSGATPVVVDEKVIEPGDPARQCAQILVTSPDAPDPIEVTDPGFVHYDPAVSPDGQWIVYVSQITGNDEIFKVRRNGSENTRLTENIWEWDKHPTWSPDGTEIVFWSNREGRKQLYVMSADGSNLRNVSNNGFNDWDPVWVR